MDSIAPKPHSDKFLLAVCCCVFSHLMFAIMSATAKGLSETHHVAEIAFYRNLIAVLPFFLFLILTRRQRYFKTERPLLVLFRAGIGSISLIVSYAAVSMLPMSYATVLFFTSSLMAPMMAHFVLKEKIGIHRWAAIFIGMSGVLIIAQPSGAVSMMGLIFAIVAATLHAMMYTALRVLKHESPITVTFYFVLAGMVIPGLAMPWIAQTPSADQIPYFLLLGVSGGLAQLSLSTAYKYAPVSFITPFAYTALLWSVLFDVFIWHYKLNYTAVFTGAFIILCAQLYIIYREYVRKAQKNKISMIDK